MKTWHPSKSARREFAQKMQNEEFAAAYNQRKAQREEKRRATSSFDYNTAGGEYVPTKVQYDTAIMALNTLSLSAEQKDACNQVTYGYSCNEKVHHDSIHIVNEIIRSN